MAATLKKTLSSGIFYTVISKYSNVFLSIFIGAILARLLTPEEFGIVAIVTVFVTFFNFLSDFGLGPAVIQNQTLTADDIKSIFSFSILISIIMAGLFFFAAPVIAQFYNELDLINVSRWLSLAILFYSLQIIPKAMSQKKLRFKHIGIISIIVQITSGTIAIILAYRGFSYYALVTKSIIDSFLTLIAFYWLSPIKFTLRIKKSAIKKIAHFSSFQFLFNFINYFSRNTDNLLIGKYISSSALGFYDKSYRLMMMPVQNLTHVITPVLLPVLSKYQNDKKMVYKSYYKVVKFLATIGFPLSILLYFSAPEIIRIIYGSQWEQSIPIFKLLALTVGIQMVLSSSGSIFQAVNRTDLLFISGFISAIIMVCCISYGVFIGRNLESIGYGLIVAFSINFFQGFYLLIRYALRENIFKFLKVFISPILQSLIMAIFIWLATKFNYSNIYYSLMVKILVAGCFFVLTFLIFKENQEFLKQYLRKDESQTSNFKNN